MTSDMAALLVIDRGDLPSLTACAIQPDPGRLVLWHQLEPDAGAPRRREAVQTHAEAWGIGTVVTSRSMDLGVSGMAPPPDLFMSCMLLQAITVARQIGCRSIVWPHQVGPRGEDVALAVDRAHTVAALADLGAGAASIAIELPLVDLDDGQILELADETGAPLRGFWPCELAGAGPCGECSGCGRWHAAFQDRHLPWPWETVAEPG